MSLFSRRHSLEMIPLRSSFSDPTTIATATTSVDTTTTSVDTTAASDASSVITSTTSHSPSSSKSISSFRSTSGFTLTELIVVITILAILATIGFVVMSHQSSVARDGKRISDIKTLSESARITSAQLRLLPTPIADSIALTVSGTFIGYQGFMSTALVNPLGYGSDKIFDPKDNIPYTYRVNQYYDSAQFMAYLENPRFERSIEIAGIMNGGGFDGNGEIGMNGFGRFFDGKKMQEIASQSLYSTLSSSLPSPLPSLFPQAYALDSSTIDLASRYPYAVGDMLGVFITKGTNQPLQSGVTGTGSRDISLSDSGTLSIIVGSEGADGYVSTDISTGSLLSLKNGSFGSDALLALNKDGSGSTGSGSGGGGLPVSHILTMGEYSIMGNTYYGYVGPLTISAYASLGVTIITVTPGSLIDDTVDGYVIDTIILDSSYQAPVTILAGSTNMPSGVAFETPYANISCTPQSSFLDITPYSCTGSTVSTDFYIGSQHDLGITFPVAVIPPSLLAPANITDAPLNEDIISSVVTASIPNSDNLSVTNGEFRVNGGLWVSTSQINNGDQIEYRTQVTQENERKIVGIVFNGTNSEWTIDAYSCFLGEGNVSTMIISYKDECSRNVSIPDQLYGKDVTSIGNQAFRNKNIQSVIIPSSVTSIGSSAFYQNQLTSVTLPTNLASIDNYAFAFNQITSVTIPSGVTTISYNSFRNNQISSLTIPNSVTSIGEGAFVNNQLTSITIPSSVTSIGGGVSGGAFQYNQLTSVTIPSSVTNIGVRAFQNNELTSVTLPSSITNIGSEAFRDQTNSLGNGTVYGPVSGYIYDEFIADPNYKFDTTKLPNYTGQ